MLCVEVKDKIKRLRKYLPPKSLSQAELAERVKVSTSQIGHLERGRIMTEQQMQKFEVALRIPKTWWVDDDLTEKEVVEFVQGLEEPPNIEAKHPSKLTRKEGKWTEDGRLLVPVWRGVAAGDPDLDECYFDTDSTEEKEVHSAYIYGDPEAHVMCVATGMSMHPRISHAERVLVRLDPDVPAGHLVVARSPEGRNYIKRLVQVGDLLELHSINEKYKPITKREGWEIKGGVVVIWHTYEPGKPNIEDRDGLWLP